MRRRLGLPVCLTLAILFAIQLAAQESSPPVSMQEGTRFPGNSEIDSPAKSVKALLLKSWGTTSVWADLKTNWNKYGNIPVTIDDSTFINSDFTYQDLINSKANVLVISDPAGNFQLYSPAEIAAVAKYARKGHTVIGTYLVFQWSTTDNRGLAPVFGLRSDITYNTTAVNISNQFKKTYQRQCLLKKIPGSSWQSQGYAQTQTPLPSMSWTHHLGKAKGVAEVDNFLGVISLYKAKTYTGVYVSNFPEYFGGTDDEQLLYNAVTCYVK
jgi:hypothetical protein